MLLKTCLKIGFNIQNVYFGTLLTSPARNELLCSTNNPINTPYLDSPRMNRTCLDPSLLSSFVHLNHQNRPKTIQKMKVKLRIPNHCSGNPERGTVQANEVDQ